MCVLLPSTLLLCASSVGRLELVGGGSLQISNLTEEDGGIYTCTASNANATIEAQTQLTIQGMFSKILSQCQNIKKTDNRVQQHQECRHQASQQMECELKCILLAKPDLPWSVDCNICMLHESGSARSVTAHLTLTLALSRL